ncbi:MAG: class I SAM-dependent methyltransferase [Candidatus Omnitrophica bacterium]|nr:class I SAM-dependent methyltransferase [Candidatus Omnitrophota bacterium]
MISREAQQLFDHFTMYPDADPVAIDLAHDVLIAGMILSRKPQRVAEFGVGSGFVSGLIAKALHLNAAGRLTCVDNLHDWKGAVPPQIEKLHSLGRVEFVREDEYAFLKKCPSKAFDLIVSDGDHVNAYYFLDHIFRVAAKDAVIFFHDTNNSIFPNLRKVERVIKAHGLFYCHFREKTIAQERTDRGLLLVFKNKDVPVNIPLKDRLRWQWKMLKVKRRAKARRLASGA